MNKLLNVRVNVTHELKEKIREEARLQNCSESMVGLNAIQLYLDAMHRLRSKTKEPINLKGFLSHFNNSN